MRLTKEQVNLIRNTVHESVIRNSFTTTLANQDMNALLAMADELLNGAHDRKTAEIEDEKRKHKAACDAADEKVWTAGFKLGMSEDIRDLRDICETLAKRIAALEGKPRERDCERRRYWVADRRKESLAKG